MSVRSQEVPAERDQPYDVPFREVIHEERNYGPDGSDLIGHVGTVRDDVRWETQEEWDEELADLKRRDEARRRLGGFGFRPAQL